MEGTCAVTSDGSAFCWGGNTATNLVGGYYAGNYTPVQLPRLSYNGMVTDIAIGQEHGCISYQHGFVDCWGSNFRGQLGDGKTINRGFNANFSSYALKPDIINTIVEGTNVDLFLDGDALDGFEPNSTSIQLDLPQGLVLNNSNMICLLYTSPSPRD